MVLQGQVGGYSYPIVQQEYEKPIDGTKTCKICKRKFVPKGRKNQVYCSNECRAKGIARQKRNSKVLKRGW